MGFRIRMQLIFTMLFPVTLRIRCMQTYLACILLKVRKLLHTKQFALYVAIFALLRYVWQVGNRT